MFFCEYCEIFKKTYFEDYLQTAASAMSSSYRVNLLICSAHFCFSELQERFASEKFWV